MEEQQKVVVEATPLDQNAPTAYQGVISQPEHDTGVYHNDETSKIAADRAKDVDAAKDKPYSYSANGYTVKARTAGDQEKGFADENGFIYDVTGNKMLPKVYGNKRDAEIFVETHSAAFASQSATMPSA